MLRSSLCGSFRSSIETEQKVVVMAESSWGVCRQSKKERKEEHHEIH